MPNARDASRSPAGPVPGVPAGPRPSPAPGRARSFPEPPEFRAHPLAPEGSCVNCGTPAARGYANPRCWECGRALCADCFWRHGLSPADHRCAGCASRGGTPPLSVSGGRSVAAHGP